MTEVTQQLEDPMVSTSYPMTSVLGLSILKEILSSGDSSEDALPRAGELHLSRLVDLVTSELSLLSSCLGFNSKVIFFWMFLWPHKLGIYAPPSCPSSTRYSCSQALTRVALKLPTYASTFLLDWELYRPGRYVFLLFSFLFAAMPKPTTVRSILTQVRCVSDICGIKEWVRDWRTVRVLWGEVIIFHTYLPLGL